MIKTIDLNDFSLIDAKATSSKGNQLKWLVRNNWYKADHMGYEGLCEVVISKLLEKSNITGFVTYFPIQIKFDGKELNGCYSKNFKNKNESLITLEHLSRQWLGGSMTRELLKYGNPKDKIRHTVEFVEKTTGLEKVGEYFATMLELDAFFLNEDRHTNNIAFVRNDDSGEYGFCPYFDFGLSLLSDTSIDFPVGGDIYEMMNKLRAKPFDRDFDIQLDAAQELYGEHLRFCFANKDIESAFEAVEEYNPPEIISRAKALLYNQKQKYRYFFV